MLDCLVVEDDLDLQKATLEMLRQQEISATGAASIEEARRALESQPFHLVLLDIELPDGSGLDLLNEGRSSLPRTDFVILTGAATVANAVEALRKGATDFLTKPVDMTRLEPLLASVRRRTDLDEQVDTLRSELRKLGRFGPMVGRSPAITRVFDLITKVAPTDATVLVTGESGTGKELAAEAIFELSRRRKQPFLPLNCGAVSPTLIESQLFGHERGSFTGAERTHHGFFERANTGTLFLDEITEMPMELQVKLLRVLETGRFMRVGGEQAIDVDVRVIAATNRSSVEAVEEGKLREDLHYRLNVFPIELPPLRERGDDIDLLANHFLDDLNEKSGDNKRWTDEALQALRAYHWPGNVRELKNLTHRAFILAGDEPAVAHVPVVPGSPIPAPAATANGVPAATSTVSPATTNSDPGVVQITIGTTVADAEKALILSTYERCDQVKRKTARVLGISLKTLYNRLHEYEIL